MHAFLKFVIATLTIFLGIPVTGQSLYSRAFGKASDEPIIFLHGGPGSSAVYFEATTAQKLADAGFYVIIYDRRGEGRSKDSTARMNYEEFFEDLNTIYQKYHLSRAHLIGFSFGGLVTTLYAEKHPEKVKSIILASALVSQQASYNTMLQSVERIYRDQNDTTNIAQINTIRKMDSNSLPYRTAVFAHASKNGFFSLSKPDLEARQIYSTYPTDTLIARYVKNDRAVETLWKNDTHRNIDVTPVLKTLRNGKIPVYAIYGKQDGLYSNKQIDDLAHIIGKSRLVYLDNCSHTCFIDQQARFIGALKSWLQ
ncbi:proline iminopeptidase [Dyadobacter sp. BE34]|uniref:Proline iminopeptidase n=1 Tax=Dyadobacter fermentans TaxID=94254 RepID=A0ABU1QZL6_9BACT|nr:MULTISPECIES: alpha/beta hydrolase [Dyadobacter]MDR6806607.1 proline iminopeptidase [Dyadobacter fermentans]MDR7044349.1 proline iminopeptidase [Dyadobacter sp. BE242]MDR7198659.1 proline iminopeptidase [Dyadobacter sp. BE34]MDR7216621.1 proline iminopeptidase [Dyadobacter sp. BE31]MDR7263853.1 proline iminopeptidase [Dyadobacter sp. BE32]